MVTKECSESVMVADEVIPVADVVMMVADEPMWLLISWCVEVDIYG